MIFTLSPGRVTRALALAVAALVLAGVAGQFSKYVLGHDRLLGFVRLFDLDQEGNVPTWYSSMLLLLAAALLAAIGHAKRAVRARHAAHWGVLAVVFLGLSIDEAASIHELSIRPLRAAWGAGGAFYFPWVVPGAAFVLLLALLYARFLRDLPGRTRRLFLVAAAIFLGGTLGVEVAGGFVAQRLGEANLTYALVTHVEETLEMAGLVVFIHALLSYLASEVGPLEIRWGATARKGPGAPHP